MWERRQQRFVASIVSAFVPAAVAGVFLYRIIKDVLFSPWVVAGSFIGGGFLILLIERIRPRPAVNDVDQLSWGPALGIGCCPVLAVIPRRAPPRASATAALLPR